MAGPLGELFDHGCDALNTTFECLLCISALNLGRSYWTVASLVATLSTFYLTTWEEYHTGTLFLSAFSGPVEGILMICAIYFITAIAGGPSFWDQGIFNVTGLENFELVRKSALLRSWNIPLNETFMTFGAFGLLANIVASYSNVAAARRKRSQAVWQPAAGLFPLVAAITANIVWLSAQNARILADGKTFVPFCLFWGLTFAYNVGLVIVAHVTKAPFPYWNMALIWSILGALDASLPSPLVQSSIAKTQLVVYASLIFSFLLYAHFCHNVVTTITSELGTACFSVRPPTINKKLGEQIRQLESAEISAKAKGKAKAQ